MRMLAACALLCAAMPSWGAAQAQQRAVQCGSPAWVDRLELQQIAEISATSAGVLRVRELGVDLVFAAGESEQWKAVKLRPPKLGEAWVRLQAGDRIRLRSQRAQVAPLRVELLCESELSADQRCLVELTADQAAPAASELQEIAFGDGHCAAAATHELAQLAANAGMHRVSAQRYRDLVQRWSRLGVGDRAAAAELGLAEQLLKAGEIADAERVADRAAIDNAKAGNVAYATRSQVTRAVALRRLGQLEESRQLLLATIPEFEELGERSEVANVHFNLALAALMSGNRPRFEFHLHSISQIDASALTPVMQSRIALARARGESAAGHYVQALSEQARAQSVLEGSAFRGDMAVAARNLAMTYLALGMHEEAYQQLTRALTISPASESPQRTASTLLVLAAVDLDNDRPQQAQRWIGAARQIYGQLRMPMEAATAEAGELALELRLGADPHRVIERIEGLRRGYPGTASDTCAALANARTAIGDAASALKTVDDESCRPGSLDKAIDLVEARALAAGVTQPQLAQQQLLAFAQQLSKMLGEASPGLHYAAQRRLTRLRSVWLQLQARQGEPGQSPQSVLEFALATHPLRFQADTGESPPRMSERLASPAIGTILLDADGNDSEVEDLANREILSRLARRAAENGSQLPSLSNIQGRLAPGTWMLVLLGGDTQGLALWLSREGSYTVPLPPLSVQRDLLARLLDRLRSPGTAVAEVVASARELSAALLTGAPGTAPPDALWVLSDEQLSGTPLALLSWPGAEAPLVETTNLSWITSIHDGPEAGAVEIRRFRASLHAIVAANIGNGAYAGLAPLYAATYEPQLIKASMPALELTTRSGAEGTAEALMDALKTPGAIVHLAAHGIARPGLLGYAGVWLAARPDASEPQFLSWLDLADQPLRAQLAVLNACQLGAGSETGNRGSLSFASALANAGVDQVVAATWPVSDAAAGTWVPAFYSHLDPERPDTSAAALRAAQLALRRSRHFRHPYYWASLGHYQALAASR